MTWFLTLGALLTSMAGAAAPVAQACENSADYPGHTFNEVWDAIIDVIGDRDWEIDELERERGIIATDWMRDDDLSPDSNHYGRLFVVVQESNGDTPVRVTTSWRGTRTFENKRDVVECLSTGVLDEIQYESVWGRMKSGR